VPYVLVPKILTVPPVYLHPLPMLADSTLALVLARTQTPQLSTSELKTCITRWSKSRWHGWKNGNSDRYSSASTTESNN
jgi:hypothetical protein